jgi:hypothetical protein
VFFCGLAWLRDQGASLTWGNTSAAYKRLAVIKEKREIALIRVHGMTLSVLLSSGMKV